MPDIAAMCIHHGICLGLVDLATINGRESQVPVTCPLTLHPVVIPRILTHTYTP